jgi:hypothetical protein
MIVGPAARSDQAAIRGSPIHAIPLRSGRKPGEIFFDGTFEYIPNLPP